MFLTDILNAMPGDPGWIRPLPHKDGSSWLYPIMIIIGFAVAILLSCLKMWKRYKISIEPFYWFILIGVPLAIVGANFGSCVLDSFWRMAGCPGGSSPGKPWSEFFTKFGSGLAIEWGVMFVMIAAFIYFPLILRLPKYKVRDEFGPKPAVKRTSMWLYFDAVMPCILIAQFLGRWGNYFNQEVYGAVVTNEGLAWFLYKCLPGMYINGAWHQPLFLWEGLGNLVMFFVLYFGIEFVKQRKAGDLSACYLIWYGVFRAGLETLRDQSFKSTSSIVLSAIFATVGVLFILFNHLFMARARYVKGTKLFFSPLIGCYLSYFFTSRKLIKKMAPKKIEKFTNKLHKLEKEVPKQINEFNININTKIDYINKKINEIKLILNQQNFNKIVNCLNDETLTLKEKTYIYYNILRQKRFDNNNFKLLNQFEYRVLALKNKMINNEYKQQLKIDACNGKILYYKNYDLYMAYKIVFICEDKINSLKLALMYASNQQNIKLINKLTKKVDIWENRLADANATLENVEAGRARWSYPKDMVRTENEMIYYCKW